MTAWLKSNMSTVWSWAAVLAGALILFGVSRGTAYQQIGIGLLASVLALLVGMALFEAIWQIAARSLDSPNGEKSPGSPPKSRSGRR